jgi:hypothetical protein
LDEKTREKNIECLMQYILLNCIYWYMFLFFYIVSSLLKKIKMQTYEPFKIQFWKYESVRNKCYEFDPIPNLFISLVWVFYIM